jgi:8-oxo-dGTP diphosphatase
MQHKQPALAADAVVFDAQNRLLLIRRKFPPFKGRYALPGGFVEYGETVETAAARELREETGLKSKSLRLVGIYSDPKRDPRHRLRRLPHTSGNAAPKAGDDAHAAEFVADWRKKTRLRPQQDRGRRAKAEMKSASLVGGYENERMS